MKCKTYGCNNEIVQKARGRKRVYCSQKCRSTAQGLDSHSKVTHEILRSLGTEPKNHRTHFETDFEFDHEHSVHADHWSDLRWGWNDYLDSLMFR